MYDKGLMLEVKEAEKSVEELKGLLSKMKLIQRNRVFP